jgi:putative ABC transport system substrate-binding protein
MRRREFIAGLGGAAAWPLAARAQQPAMPVVGYLIFNSFETNRDRRAAFHRGLAEVGYVEGRNVAIEYRSAENRMERVPELMADLVRRRVDVIGAFGSTSLALAAKAATQTIPTVFILGSDPVHIGLVASLARPGGNITGITLITAEMVAKRFELLHEMVPAATSIALLVNPTNPYSETEAKEVQRAGHALGLRAVILNARNQNEFEGAFANLAQQQVGALLVSADPIFVAARAEPIIALAARHRVPASYQFGDSVVGGGLMSYGPIVNEEWRQLGIYTGRILKGEKPANLPVLQPTKFELVINLKTAKALGLTVPETLLATADEVIQ